MSIKGFIINGSTQKYDFNALDNKPTTNEIPAGGSTGQVLAKNSSANYDVAWVDQTGGGGGGTSDYSQLTNKPSINGVTLTGNKTAADLALVATGDLHNVPAGGSAGQVLAKTSSTNYDVTWVTQSGGGGSGDGLTDAVKEALLQIAQKVAYIDEHGQQYYQALFDALYSGSATYIITNNLTNVTNSNTSTTATGGDSYTGTLTAPSGYTINSVQILMGGNDVTGTSYSGGTITIANVTGNIVITAVATQRQATLSSISCVFNQGSAVILSTDSLDSLKQYLTVTAHWSDSTTSTVASSDYTLSGTLTVGTSTITASYGGKTDTFTVVVSSNEYTYEIVGTGVVNTNGGVDNNSNYNLTDFIELDSNYSAFTFVHDAMESGSPTCYAQFFNGDTYVNRLGLSKTTNTTRQCNYSSIGTVTKVRLSWYPKTLGNVRLMKGLV